MAVEIDAHVPHSAVAGSEMGALAPFYRDWRWTGTIEANGMGPGSPEMVGEGQPRIRLTWALTDRDHATWRNEYTLDGEAWTLIEEYALEATPPAS